MDENKTINHWKQYRRYWGLVIRRTIPMAWVRIGGFFTLVVPTTIAIWQSLRVKPFESMAEFLARPDLMGYFAFILVAFLFVLVLMSLEPMRLNQEQETDKDKLKSEVGKLEEQLRQETDKIKTLLVHEKDKLEIRLQSEIDRLTELTRPKLELSYDESKKITHYTWSETTTDFRVIVKNMGSEQLKDVAVKIIETRPEIPHIHIPFELTVMHNESDVLNPSDHRIVNILETHADLNSLHFCTKNPHLQQQYALRNYEIRLSASADKSPVKTKWFKFSVNPPGSEHAYKFEEIDRE